MANKILGIHLSPNVVKLVELEQQTNTFKILNWSDAYFSSDKAEENQLKSISAVLKQKKIESRQAVVTLSSYDVVYKLVELPLLPEKEIESALKFKIESALSYPIKDAIYDYYKIGEAQTAGKQTYFVTIIQKERVQNVIKLLKKAGIAVKEIVPFSTAIKNASAVQDSDPYALVNFGKYSTAVVLVKRGQVVFAREVSVGGEAITQAIVGEVQAESGKLEFDPAKAEEIRVKFGVPINAEEYTREAGLPAAEMMAMMRPALEKIGAEILRTLEYYCNESGDALELKKIYATGGVSKTKNFIEFLGSELGIEILPMPLSLVSSAKEFNEAAPMVSIAMGAAFLKKPYLSLLPRKGKIGFRFTLRDIFSYFGLAIIYLLILAVIFAFFFNKTQSLKTKLLALKNELKQTGAAAGKGVSAEATALNIKELGLKGGTDRFVKIVGDAHRLTPQDIYFKKLSYDRSANLLIIDGIVLKEGRKNSLPQFIERLKTKPYFKTIDLSSLQETNAFTVPAYEFEIKAALAGEIKP